jgi:hypothetical protein
MPHRFSNVTAYSKGVTRMGGGSIEPRVCFQPAYDETLAICDYAAPESVEQPEPSASWQSAPPDARLERDLQNEQCVDLCPRTDAQRFLERTIPDTLLIVRLGMTCNVTPFNPVCIVTAGLTVARQVEHMQESFPPSSRN